MENGYIEKWRFAVSRATSIVGASCTPVPLRSGLTRSGIATTTVLRGTHENDYSLSSGWHPGFGACTEATRPSERPVPSLQATWQLVSTIAFTSTRDDPSANPLLAAEVYLVDGDGGNPRRITANADGDGFPTSDLLLMNADGTEQQWLVRGASANWSPDGKHVVFHRSASGTALPIKPDPGAATFDSDIFMMNVDDALISAASPTNLTNSPGAIDDDPDWSPDGNRIVFTSHDATDNHLNSVTAEIYVIDLSESGGPPVQLTDNLEEERAAAWSPDGTRISFMCRRGGPDFEICVMNADGTGQVQ
jgi:Tol biopolymer transport system component